MIRPVNCSTLDKLIQRAAVKAHEAEAASDDAHRQWVRAMRQQRRYELLGHVNREVCGLSDSRQVRGRLVYVGHKWAEVEAGANVAKCDVLRCVPV